jgi:hypothetical protein
MAAASVALDLWLDSHLNKLHGDIHIIFRQVCGGLIGCDGDVREVCVVSSLIIHSCQFVSASQCLETKSCIPGPSGTNNCDSILFR